MGSINTKRRLDRLEVRADVCRDDERAAASRKVLARMTDDELRVYVAALRRMKAGEGPSEEDGPILQRVEALYEEVAEEG